VKLMCRGAQQSRYRGYFSIDAGFALFIAVIAFSSFALLASSAASSAHSQSQGISSSLVALRFSSFVLEQAAASGAEPGNGAYSSTNELDISKLQGVDLDRMRSEAGKSYARVSVGNGETEIFSSEAGIVGGEVFCARRLAILSGEIVRLEACLG
jgi:hypothetical protein